MSEHWKVTQLTVMAEIGKVSTASAILARTDGDQSAGSPFSITLTVQGHRVISPDELLQYREYVRRIVEDCVHALNYATEMRR